MSHSPSLPRARQLSLTEFLIAVAIGGVLLSLLGEAHRSSSEAADIARCRSNLHEVGAALHFYAADNEGRMPPFNPNDFEIGIFATRVGDGNPHTTTPNSVGVLVGKPYGYGSSGYLSSWNPLFCPSQTVYTEPGPEETPTNIGYMWAYLPQSLSWWSQNNLTNDTIDRNPLTPILVDLGAFIDIFPSVPLVPSHETQVNSLHLGGHVSTRSLEDARQHTSLGPLFRFLAPGVVNPRS